MPILDPAARAASLADDYGPTRGAGAPDAYTVHLFVGNPALEGVEMPDETELDDESIVDNGYAPAVVDSDDFTPDDMGISVLAQFPNPLAEWPETATHWLLRDSVDGTGWDHGVLSEPLDVTAAGDGPLVTCTVFYDDDITAP